MKKELTQIKQNIQNIKDIILESEMRADLSEFLGSPLLAISEAVKDLENLNENLNKTSLEIEEIIHPKHEIKKKTKFKNIDIG